MPRTAPEIRRRVQGIACGFAGTYSARCGTYRKPFPPPRKGFLSTRPRRQGSVAARPGKYIPENGVPFSPVAPIRTKIRAGNCFSPLSFGTFFFGGGGTAMETFSASPNSGGPGRKRFRQQGTGDTCGRRRISGTNRFRENFREGGKTDPRYPAGNRERSRKSAGSRD